MKNTHYVYKIRKCRGGFQVFVTCTKTNKKYYASPASTYKEAVEFANALVVTLTMGGEL